MTTSNAVRRGRPTLLTPSLVEKLGKAVEAGMTRDEAAEFAGVNVGSFARWLTRGRKAYRAATALGTEPSPQDQVFVLLALRIAKARGTLVQEPGLAKAAGLESWEKTPAWEREAAAAVQSPVLVSAIPQAGRGFWNRARALLGRAPLQAR
ncbi:hypothetical protein ACFYZ9_33800 [Streptomyces sp. NPDC001691]|uniref:hypothetical protein n=1 Tax=Streptomyces sp. NPDC001691 TaxID=3364600 RepID=UPI0036B10AA5